MTDKPQINSDEVSIEAYNERLSLLLNQSYPAAYLSVLVGLLLVVILWGEQDHQRLVIWYSCIVLTAAARIFIYLSYRRTPPKEPPVTRREILYRASTLTYFAVWGLGGLWVIQGVSLLDKVIALYFLIGLAGSAISVFSASRFLQLGAILILVLPFVLWFLAMGDVKPVAMAAAGAMFLISAIRSSKVLADAIQMNFTLKHNLLQANAQAEHLARVDELTQLFNRRAFYEHCELQLTQSMRTGNPLSLVLLDLDHFKRINDSYGHSVGDAALVHIAGLLSGTIRSSDICGRVGGEEFAVLLPGTSVAQAEKVAQNLREKLASTPFEFPDGAQPVTASFGVTAVTGDILDMVRDADSALYSAKSAGRNRVVVA